MTRIDPQQIESPEAKFLRVGNFALFSHRNCQQARAHFGLSKRDVEVVLHIAGGLTKQEIADQIGVSPASADTFRRRAYAKLGVKSGAAAVAIVGAYLAGTRVEEQTFGNAA